ncbi:hypothetical protein [Eleftheria terrae]|nr:hypothetical protein [Eleftheria terrae]WKB50566.1 hypothetical protein N7L95_00160 [Eleftheria terrae]
MDKSQDKSDSDRQELGHFNSRLDAVAALWRSRYEAFSRHRHD